MKALSISVLLLLSLALQAQEGFYTGFGGGFHSERYDCPEVCYGGDVLIRLEAGYSWQIKGRWYAEVEVAHQSNPFIKEKGHGSNDAMGIIKRYW